MALKILCEDYDFSALAGAFEGEFKADCPLSMEIIIVDEAAIKKLNNDFRQKDSVTDVLSFPALEGIFQKEIKKCNFPYDIEDDGSLFIGSVAICKAVATAQAEEYGHSFLRELNYLAAHGVCHLLGYDHIEDKDRAVMREKEERVLAKINLTRQ